MPLKYVCLARGYFRGLLPSWSSSRPAASLVCASVTAVNMHLCGSPALPSCICLIHTVLYTRSLGHKTSRPRDPCPICLTFLSLGTHRVPDHSDPARALDMHRLLLRALPCSAADVGGHWHLGSNISSVEGILLDPWSSSWTLTISPPPGSSQRRPIFFWHFLLFFPICSLYLSPK